MKPLRASAQTRSAVYDFLSLGFLYPWAPTSLGQRIASGLADHPLICSAHPLTAFGPGEGAEVFSELCSILKGLNVADLEAQYVCVMGHTLSPECPPYETEYGGGSGEAAIFQKTQRLADIAGFYRAWGLEVSQQAKERPDHIAIELEFMGYLIWKEVYAMAKGFADEKIKRCREAQQKFLKDHLGWWVPSFTRLLERRSAEAGSAFYQQLARLTRIWLDEEFAVLAVAPPPEEASLHVQKEEPGCDSCPLAGS